MQGTVYRRVEILDCPGSESCNISKKSKLKGANTMFFENRFTKAFDDDACDWVTTTVPVDGFDIGARLEFNVDIGSDDDGFRLERPQLRRRKPAYL